MAPVAQSALCQFHESRINALDDQISEVAAEQGKTHAKLDDLTQRVQELKEEVSSKLDKILDRTELTSSRIKANEDRTKLLENWQASAKKIALKVIPPIGIALIGVLAGASGGVIRETIVKLFGG